MANYRDIYKKHYGINFGREYVVHHIDENRDNNDISNLLLLPNVLHSKYHTYKTQFLQNTNNGKICFDLTYSGIMVRDWQFSCLQDLKQALSEISFWISQKYLADHGYREAYKMFKGDI